MMPAVYRTLAYGLFLLTSVDAERAFSAVGDLHTKIVLTYLIKLSVCCTVFIAVLTGWRRRRQLCHKLLVTITLIV